MGWSHWDLDQLHIANLVLLETLTVFCWFPTAHSWMEEHDTAPEDTHECGVSCSEHLTTRDNSISVSFIARDQDISFGTGSAVNCEPESPTFSCGSSFSTFMVEPSTPTLVSSGFTFRSSGDFKALEFVSPIPSMPSFTFFSAHSINEHENQNGGRSSYRESTDKVHAGK